MDKQQIEKQAKEILEKFARALERVEKESTQDYQIKREPAEREEKKTTQTSVGFKESMLENAPKKNKDFIIAEKGNWK